MKLHTVTFSGYRRFLEETKLKLNGKMTALIGPNEAGKSSTLKLLAHLENSDEFEVHERYRFRENVPIKISAEFLLDANDHDAIGSTIPTRYILTKVDDGGRTHSIEPRLRRPTSHREGFKKALKKCVDSKHFGLLADLDESELKRLRRSVDGLNIDQDNIPIDSLGYLNEIQSFLSPASDENLPKYMLEAVDKIAEFRRIELQPHPNDEALETIDDRVPKILEFTDADRQLDPTFNVMYFEHEKPEAARAPSNALANLCEISKLDLRMLKANLDADRSDRIAGQFTNANARLKGIFDGAWSQSEISVHLQWHKPEIHVMIRIEGVDAETDAEFNPIRDRSDGFRQYVALLAFIIKEDAQKPILLIDEAELHLHYDAQADLIQTFTERNLTSQVIYTTHSAGCLPEDLGVGVKLVAPIENGTDLATSKIENNFWSTDTLGFSPLLYGMGAETLAFFPTRRAVVAEGQTEMLLLPTIFRQVSGEKFNGFQVVPGLANASDKNLPLFARQGSKVSYFLDNDKAGKDYAKKLAKAEVSERCIFYVGGKGSKVVTLEDWISDQVFSDAIETYRQRYFNDKPCAGTGFFDGDGKSAKVKVYEKKIKKTISKIDLAYLILEAVGDDPELIIFNSRHKKLISDVRDGLLSSLE
jgi:predicted ATP-dependent endonuclease of OLD family